MQSSRIQQARLGLTVEEAAKTVGVSRTALYESIRSRNLKITKIGKRTIIRVAELNRWLESLQRAAREPAA